MQGQPKRHLLHPDQQEAQRIADRLRKMRRALREGKTPKMRKPTPGAIPYLQSVGLLDKVELPPVGINRTTLNKEYKKRANKQYREGFWPNVKFDKHGRPI